MEGIRCEQDVLQGLLHLRRKEKICHDLSQEGETLKKSKIWMDGNKRKGKQGAGIYKKQEVSVCCLYLRKQEELCGRNQTRVPTVTEPPRSTL